MKIRFLKENISRIGACVLLSVCVFTMAVSAREMQIVETSATVAIEEPNNLYAKAAVLMDAESGRVLYEKNGYELMPMASTTKIMTCIVALENGNLEDIVKVSKYASTMPDVQLNMRENEEYRLKDLLYSIMLESHNDSAVAIAEHIGGSVEGFTRMMNQKARDIGCYETYFITPNGLDATAVSEDGKTNLFHATTATELAKIMAYCINQSPQKAEFLEITGTPSYTFSELTGKRNFSCNNHNAFLTMMEGALSGKTGFTGKAGYCYVGALERDGKKLTVALLACGWPSHKSYKWSDVKKLMGYGLENYEFKSFDTIEIDKDKLKPIIVENGQKEKISGSALIQPKLVECKSDTLPKGLLMRADEKIEVVYTIPSKLAAPVEEGEDIGNIQYKIKGETWKIENVVADTRIDSIDFRWCLIKIKDIFLIK